MKKINAVMRFKGVLLAFLFLVITIQPLLAFSCDGIPDQECDALYALYRRASGDQWKNNLYWLSSRPVDDWYGVRVEDGHVISIGLGRNNLTGSIPPELGNLSNLTHLSLSDNNLSGSIPPELGNLGSLIGLFLSSNNLTGSIPPELGSMDSLMSLSLEHNALTGSIPPELGKLPILSRLSIYRNKLTGPIPPELGKLFNLTRLQLQGNDLTGSIPPGFANLWCLEWADLSGNSLSGSIPPELEDLTNLEWFDLRGNKLTGSIPPQLGNLSNLRQLNISRNHLSGEIPSELGNLSSLTHLYLRFNRLTGSIPATLGNLANLREIILYSNCLTGSIPDELGNLENLGKLFLQSNCLSGDLPAFLVNPPYAMDFSWNRLYASDPDVLAAIESRHEGKFISTQTLPPGNIRAVAVPGGGNSGNQIEVSWEPIDYRDDPGGYQVFYRKKGGGEFIYAGITSDKTVDSFRVSGLDPEAEYEFKVNTVTWHHRFSINDLRSDDSDTVTLESMDASGHDTASRRVRRSPDLH